MQFAYIDSQGKEVGIPSIEGLQLRIELGAVGEETMFFDARNGKWARAAEHEIFRTLVREVRGDREEKPSSGAGPGDPSGAPAGVRDGVRAEDGGGDAPGSAASVDGSQEEEVPDVLDPASLLDHGGDADSEAEELDGFDLSAFELNEPEAAGGSELFLGGSELQLEDMAEEDEPSSGTGGGSSPPGWFEAGPEEDGLELEEAWEAGASTTASPGLGEVDLPPDAPEPGGGAPDAPAPDTPAPDAPARDATAPDAAPRETAALDAAPPESAAPDGVTAEGPRPDGNAPVSEHPTRQAPAPEARRPSNRRTPGRRGGSGPGRRIAVAGFLVVAGAAGWFGWTTLRGDSGTGEMEAAVVVPDLPPELEELHAQAVPGAVEALVERLREDAASLPEAPDEDWLGGEYLATASAFPGIESYWNSLGAYLGNVREREAGAFVDAYTLELEQLPVPGPTSQERLVERAEASFQAARAERADAYDRLDTLIAASLDLHEFLRANEDRITYEPTAGGFSRDPVTEAIPATRELGDEMWNRVSRITAAMDALGTVDRLTTQGLVEFVLMRVARAPVR